MELLTTDLSCIHEPFVVKSEDVQKWPCFKWTINEWISKCENVKFPFRVHSIAKNQTKIQWENEAVDYFEATFAEFIEWQNMSNDQISTKNAFFKYSKNEYWAYSSYNYMKDVFEGSKELLDSVNWSELKIGNYLAKDGMSSTFWMGSKHSYTPCHYDTYDYNLVAQISGKKLWILFPQEDRKYLYPTRIPYEESSVFSDVNICNPNLEKHRQFENSHPYVVILEPGDILYVPHQWWHFVYCIEDENGAAISINLWQSQHEYHSYASESLVRLLTSTLFDKFESESSQWINDKCKHQSFTAQEAVDYVLMAVDMCTKTTEHKNQVVIAATEAAPADRCSNVRFVKECNLNEIDQILKWDSSKHEAAQTSIDKKDVINCILDAEVMQLIVDKLIALKDERTEKVRKKSKEMSEKEQRTVN